MTDSTYIRSYNGKSTRLDNLCLGADNNSYRLYVNGSSYLGGWTRIIDNASNTSDDALTYIESKNNND